MRSTIAVAPDNEIDPRGRLSSRSVRATFYDSQRVSFRRGDRSGRCASHLTENREALQGMTELGQCREISGLQFPCFDITRLE